MIKAFLASLIIASQLYWNLPGTMVREACSTEESEDFSKEDAKKGKETVGFFFRNEIKRPDARPNLFSEITAFSTNHQASLLSGTALVLKTPLYLLQSCMRL